jgi:hypothetical protein
MTNKITTRFIPHDIGNGWGVFVDIENYTYNKYKPLLPILETNILEDEFGYYDNKYNNYNIEKNKDVINFMHKIDIATFTTILFVICMGFLFI